MDMDSFVAQFGGVYEHSPWVAERCYRDAGAGTDYHKIARLFRKCVDNASKDEQLALIQAHRTRDFDRLRYAGVRVDPLTGEAHLVTTNDEFPSLVRGITF